MKILVIGTPKRDFHIGFDNFVLGLKKAGINFDHYPNILTQSCNIRGVYQLKFDAADISYPEYDVIEDNLKKGHYDLIITTSSRVDYKGGKHGFLSQIGRRLKYSLESNKYKMGGTLVLDWMRNGILLPPFIVVDDNDDPFIWPADFDLLLNCKVYFKTEAPFNRFLCFRLFESKLNKQQQIDLAEKIRPYWISYDRESIAAFTDIYEFKPFAERDIDISYLCNIHMNFQRIKILPAMDKLGERYKVITTKNGKFSKEEFYKLSKKSKIGISLAGRRWDCPKHYELLLCGALLFVSRPLIEMAIDLKDGENCVFLEDDFKHLEKQVEYYLNNPALSSSIAERGYNLAKVSLGNDKLAEYILKIVKEVIEN